MVNFVIMFICLIAGMFIRRCAKFALADVRPVNIVILWLSLPALVFSVVPAFIRAGALSGALLAAVATPWFNFLCALLVVLGLARVFGWSRGVVGALVLTAGLGNTSFVGLPVVEALYGADGVRIALVIDQMGTFLILATLGLLVASLCSGRSLSVGAVARRILFFPPFIAILISFAWGFSGAPVEGLLVEACRRIGATLVPLALLSVGWQLELRWAVLRRYSWMLAFGLLLKLVLWPAAVFGVFHSGDLISHVTVLEAAMAPMITGAVVASEFGLEAELAQLMVGVGIPLSALTVWVWSRLVQYS